MSANTVVFQAGDKFKYLGCADMNAFAMHKIPVGTIVTLKHNVEEQDLGDVFNCEMDVSILGCDSQYFYQSELELIV